MGLYEDVNVAGGLEWHEESYEVVAGDVASFTAGPLTTQGFGIGSNGYSSRAILRARSESPEKRRSATSDRMLALKVKDRPTRSHVSLRFIFDLLKILISWAVFLSARMVMN